MTITISTSGEHRHDQSSGVQMGGMLDKDDIALSSDLSELPSDFSTFLLTAPGIAIPTDPLLNNAADYDAAKETGDGMTFFVNVVTTNGETLNDLFFSKSDGTLFGADPMNPDIATYQMNEIHVAGSSDTIYLYSFADGDILIGST